MMNLTDILAELDEPLSDNNDDDSQEEESKCITTKSAKKDKNEKQTNLKAFIAGK